MANLIDLTIEAKEYDTGAAIELYDDDALSVALTLWVVAKKGDYVLDPAEGGALESFQFKNMSNSNLEILKFNLESQIYSNFDTLLILQDIIITPEPDIRVLEVEIFYISLLSKEERSTIIYLEDPRNQKILEYQDIELVSENLYNFVTLQLPSMGGKKLTYNADETNWVWGNFRFINFNQNDPYFEKILALINT